MNGECTRIEVTMARNRTRDLGRIIQSRVIESIKILLSACILLYVFSVLPIYGSDGAKLEIVIRCIGQLPDIGY